MMEYKCVHGAVNLMPSMLLAIGLQVKSLEEYRAEKRKAEARRLAIEMAAVFRHAVRK
jgi:hypothetical protein